MPVEASYLAEEMNSLQSKAGEVLHFGSGRDLGQAFGFDNAIAAVHNAPEEVANINGAPKMDFKGFDIA